MPREGASGWALCRERQPDRVPGPRGVCRAEPAVLPGLARGAAPGAVPGPRAEVWLVWLGLGTERPAGLMRARWGHTSPVLSRLLPL